MVGDVVLPSRYAEKEYPTTYLPSIYDITIQHLAAKYVNINFSKF
jgi:hypothetical protein